MKIDSPVGLEKRGTMFTALRRYRAKRLIKQIVRFVGQDNREADNLWAILTSLRGPDHGDQLIKWVTTAALRGAIGINGRILGVDVNSLQYPELLPVSIVYPEDGHFQYHHNRSVEALQEFGFIPSPKAVNLPTPL